MVYNGPPRFQCISSLFDQIFRHCGVQTFLIQSEVQNHRTEGFACQVKVMNQHTVLKFAGKSNDDGSDYTLHSPETDYYKIEL